MQRHKQDFIRMHSYPGMVAIVGTYAQGRANFMSAGWHSYLSIDPPMYGVAIAKERHTHQRIHETRRFSINFLPCDKAHFIKFFGTTSGKDTDKTKVLDAAWSLENDQYAHLDCAYLTYACELENTVPTGDHDWFIGTITSCYNPPDIFDQEGLPDLTALNIPLYLGRSTFLKADEHTHRQTVEHTS